MKLVIALLLSASTSALKLIKSPSLDGSYSFAELESVSSQRMEFLTSNMSDQ